jgi:hypothetical protein
LEKAEVDRLPQTDDVQDEERFAQLRAEPRDSMFLLAAMRRPGGPDVQVKVRTLSSGGMMVECPVSFTRGELVESELRGIGAVGGKIAWTAGARVGVAFDRAIDPSLARKPVTGGPQPQLVKASRTMWRPGLK